MMELQPEEKKAIPHTVCDLDSGLRSSYGSCASGGPRTDVRTSEARWGPFSSRRGSCVSTLRQQRGTQQGIIENEVAVLRLVGGASSGSEFEENDADASESLPLAEGNNLIKFVRHFTIVSEEFAKQHVFKRSKFLREALKEEYDDNIRMRVAKDQGKSCIEVTVNSESQGNELVKIQKLGGIDVIITRHPWRNLVKGVFVDWAHVLDDMNNEEVAEGLQEWNPNVTKAEKLGVNGHTWKITMEGLGVPSKIKVGVGLAYKMDVFVPPPVRCFKCQQYGHTISSCRNVAKCQKCAQTYNGAVHDYKKCKEQGCTSQHCFKTCAATLKCVNCDGEHQSGDRVCDAQKLQKDINFIVHRKGVVRKEAVRQAEGQRGNTTFADVAARRTTRVNEVVAPVGNQRDPLEARLSALERMFQTWLAQASKQDGREHQQEQGRGPINTDSEDLQRQVNELVHKSDRQEEAHALLLTKFKQQEQVHTELKQKIQEGYEGFTKLTEENAKLKAENRKLQDKLRVSLKDSKKPGGVKTISSQPGKTSTGLEQKKEKKIESKPGTLRAGASRKVTMPPVPKKPVGKKTTQEDSSDEDEAMEDGFYD